MTHMRSGDPIDDRLAAVERRQDALEHRLDAFEDTMLENTETTNSIKRDTAQIVMLFKASQFGAMMVKWMALVGSAIVVGYASYKGLTK